MIALTDAAHPLDADATLALVALLDDLGTIARAVPAAEGACLHARRAFDAAFAARDDDRWRHAAQTALTVLARSSCADDGRATRARERLRGFVVENADLFEP